MKFVIKIDSSGQYRFNLVAKNGEIVASSEAYTSLEMCKKGIAVVKKCAKAKIVLPE